MLSLRHHKKRSGTNMVTHRALTAWEREILGGGGGSVTKSCPTPWTEGPGGLQSIGLTKSQTRWSMHTLLIGHLYFFLYPLWMLFVHVSVGVLVFYLWFVRTLSNYQGCFCHQHPNLLFACMFHLRVSVKVVFHESNLSVFTFAISHPPPTAFEFRMSFPIWWISISIFS